MVRRRLRHFFDSLQFTKMDLLYFIFFLLIVVPIHEFLHAIFLALFGCEVRLSFDLFVYPIVTAGYVKSSCALAYLQQKVVALAPQAITAITGMAMMLHGYTKLLDERAKLLEVYHEQLRDLEAARRTGKCELGPIRTDISHEYKLLKHIAGRDLIFWGLVLISSVIFTMVVHILLPIQTDWSVLTCAPP